MTIVRRPSPLRDMLSMRTAMDRFFDDDFRPFQWLSGSYAGPSLPLDVTTDANTVTIEAALPGIKPEDVDITVENGTLSIRADSKTETTHGEDESLVQEIRRGSVSRIVSLPNGLEPDKASATFENGILTLRIPRAEAVKPRQIRISPTTDGSVTDSSTASTTSDAAGS